MNFAESYNEGLSLGKTIGQLETDREWFKKIQARINRLKKDHEKYMRTTLLMGNLNSGSTFRIDELEKLLK